MARHTCGIAACLRAERLLVLLLERPPSGAAAREAFATWVDALPPGSAVVGANADGPVVLWGPPQGRVRSAALPAPRFADRGDLLPFARDVARALANTPAYERSRHRRKKVGMLFAHLKRILRLGRLRLRGPSGARDEFLLAATAQNLRKLAKLRSMTALA